MAKLSIDNPLFVNNKLTETRVLFLAKNETSKKVDLFALPLVSYTDLSGITRRYLNITTENNYIYNNKGTIVADLPASQSSPEGTFDLEVSIDYNSQNTQARAGMATNLLEAIFLAQGFYVSGVYYSIIGTNGTQKKTGMKATKCEINRPAGASLFYYEINNLNVGAMDSTGKPVFTTNGFQKSKLETASIALETYELLDSGNSSSTLIPYVYVGNTSFSQADDTAKMSATAMRPCDAWDAEESMLVGQREYNTITTTDKVYFEVDAIIQNSTGVNPTDFVIPNGGSATPTICVVNKTTGAFTIQKSNGTAWTAQAVGGFVGYAKISANKVGATTLALAEDVRGFAVVTSTGATNNAGTLVNAHDEGAAKDYVYLTYTLDRVNQTWVKYAPTSVC